MTDGARETDDAGPQRLKKRLRGLTAASMGGSVAGLGLGPLYVLLAVALARIRGPLPPEGLRAVSLLSLVVAVFPGGLSTYLWTRRFLRRGLRRQPFFAAEVGLAVAGALLAGAGLAGLFLRMWLAAGLMSASGAVSAVVCWCLQGLDLGPSNPPTPPLERAAGLLALNSIPALCALGLYETAGVLRVSTARVLLVGVGVVGALCWLHVVLSVKRQARRRRGLSPGDESDA